MQSRSKPGGAELVCRVLKTPEFLHSFVLDPRAVTQSDFHSTNILAKIIHNNDIVVNSIEHLKTNNGISQSLTLFIVRFVSLLANERNSKYECRWVESL